MIHVTDSKPILIVGGNGKTGRRVAERLSAKGIPVRIGSRSGTPPFDWQDQSTWGQALEGTRAAYITYFPDIAIPGAPEAIEIFAKLALAHGVRQLVLLSGRGEPEAQRSEDALIAAGVDWTILRCSWFAQNFSEAFLLDFVKAGLVQLPAGNVGEPFIDVDDIADAAVAALTEAGHIGKLYELTGPRLLTFAEAVAEIAKGSGRPIRYEQISNRAFKEMLAEAQVPADIIWLLNLLFTEVLDGRNANLTDGVQQALGRAPRDFTDYVRKSAATGIWAAS
jgi:uncharacterized protein YbjT (DUF2867 family)